MDLIRKMIDEKQHPEIAEVDWIDDAFYVEKTRFGLFTSVKTNASDRKPMPLCPASGRGASGDSDSFFSLARRERRVFALALHTVAIRIPFLQKTFTI